MLDDEDYDDYEEEKPDNGISLEAPFAELNARGIFARENYLCCSSCACAAIPEDAAKELPNAHGYCFYHLQDDDNRRDGESFYLGFGTIDPNEPNSAAVAVGYEIISVLNKHGVQTEWLGDADIRIHVIQ